MKDALTPSQHFLAARQCQIAATQARIVYWQSMLISGAYTDRKVAFLDGREFSDKEKRNDVLETIDRLAKHLQSMQDFHEEAAASNIKTEGFTEMEMVFPPNMPHSQVRRSLALLLAVRLNAQSPGQETSAQSIILNAGKFARFISERDDNTNTLAKD